MLLALKDALPAFRFPKEMTENSQEKNPPPPPGCGSRMYPVGYRLTNTVQAPFSKEAQKLDTNSTPTGQSTSLFFKNMLNSQAIKSLNYFPPRWRKKKKAMKQTKKYTSLLWCILYNLGSFCCSGWVKDGGLPVAAWNVCIKKCNSNLKWFLIF